MAEAWTRKLFWEAEDRIAASGIDLVLGSMVGAYLGMVISKSGLAAGSYWTLAALLVSCITFYVSVRAFAIAIVQVAWLRSVKWFLLIPESIYFSCVTSKMLKVDGGILLTIFSVWIFFSLSEIIMNLARKSGE